MSVVVPLAGAAVALAGGDKLAGIGGYDKLPKQIGWSRGAMRFAAAVETAGGVLMVLRSTRRLGGAVVAGVSALLLASEVQAGATELAVPRGLVLLAGLLALFSPE